jgi:transcriptional regulator with GAF, ATPase, and Fis domain
MDHTVLDRTVNTRLEAAKVEAATAAAAPSEGRILTAAELKELERDNITRALEQTGYKIYGPNGAAELLKVRPTTLSSRIRALNINRR